MTQIAIDNSVASQRFNDSGIREKPTDASFIGDYPVRAQTRVIKQFRNERLTSRVAA